MILPFEQAILGTVFGIFAVVLGIHIWDRFLFHAMMKRIADRYGVLVETNILRSSNRISVHTDGYSLSVWLALPKPLGAGPFKNYARSFTTVFELAVNAPSELLLRSGFPSSFFNERPVGSPPKIKSGKTLFDSLYPFKGQPVTLAESILRNYEFQTAIKTIYPSRRPIFAPANVELVNQRLLIVLGYTPSNDDELHQLIPVVINIARVIETTCQHNLAGKI
jgi:hypothetical protein